MSPPVLFLENIHLTFGGQPLLEGASVFIAPGDRIALVGRNGSGKSTFLKIAAGMIKADTGERFVQPGTTIRYLPQEPDMAGFESLRDYVHEGLAPGDDPHRADYMLSQLGLSGGEDPTSVSGGEARRAALARVLAPSPEILLMDEPTNHLDLPAIEWLEAELQRMKSALVLISHDRRFLSNLSKKTVWIDRGKTRLLDKSFAEFEDWRDEILETEEAEHHKLGRKIAREEHWITHGVSGRRKRNMRRVGELAELRKQRASTRKSAGDVTITNTDTATSGKLVAKLEKVSKSWEDRKVVSNFSTIIKRGDRLGIAGPNGSGKTTLVNLVTGKIPCDSGKIQLGKNLEILVIDQKREALDPNASLKEVLTGGGGDIVQFGSGSKHVVSYMKDYLFSPEQAGTAVSRLSGGERGRLMLAMGLRLPSNLLVLDEPTNDLDLETLDVLQEYIASYEGTVILVSHDRDFLDRICTLILYPEEHGVWHEYAGGYSDMVAQRKVTVSPSKDKRPAQISQKPAEPRSGERASDKPRLSFKHRHTLETLPAEMEKLQSEIAKLQKALEDTDLFSKERKKFDAYTQALTERQALLEAKETEWLELEMLREEAENQT
ncbi:MAG: ABC-F family ATP-binding cassette domain-containing protein [Pseudomonadota bacterium]